MLVTIHLTLIIVTGLAVLYSDEQAFLWLLGKKETLSRGLVQTLHTCVSWGLGSILISGGLLYFRAPVAYLTNLTFLVKLGAILALIFNTYVIEKFSEVAITRPYRSLSPRERLPLFLSGAVSVGGWSIALLCGYLLG
jgi:hypothetical protein